MTDQPSNLVKPTLSEDMQDVVTHFRLLYPDEVPLKDSAERLWSGLANLEAKLAQSQIAERYWRAEFLAEEDCVAKLQRKLTDLEAKLEAAELIVSNREAVDLKLRGERNEARQRVNNHHREPCMTCMAMESERIDALRRLETIAGWVTPRSGLPVLGAIFDIATDVEREK